MEDEMQRKYKKTFMRKLRWSDVYSARQISYLKYFAKSSNWSIRYDVAAALARCRQNFAEEILYELLLDKDEYVREEAAEVIVNGKTERTLIRLRERMEREENVPARAAIVRAYGHVYRNMQNPPMNENEFIQLMKKYIEQEKEKCVRIVYLENLCIAEKTGYAELLIQELSRSIMDEDFHYTFQIVECMLNGLSDDQWSQYMDEIMFLARGIPSHFISRSKLENRLNLSK